MIRYNVPFSEYLAIRAISAHGLMLIDRSPAHYRASIEAPREASPAQALGTLTHLAVLEWPEYQRRVRVAPDVDRRTKAGKEADQAFRDALAETPDAIIATHDQDRLARSMREAVMAQPYARALLEHGQPEVTLEWEANGIRCKARPDWVCDGHPVIVDLKTARDASAHEFARAAGNYQYHLQSAWYSDAAQICGLGERAFVFIAVEPDPPHGVALYQMDEEAMEAGRRRYERALATYRDCVETGEWPSYPREIQPLRLAPWAL
jgi:hypothetical protein